MTAKQCKAVSHSYSSPLLNSDYLYGTTDK